VTYPQIEEKSARKRMLTSLLMRLESGYKELILFGKGFHQTKKKLKKSGTIRGELNAVWE